MLRVETDKCLVEVEAEAWGYYKDKVTGEDAYWSVNEGDSDQTIEYLRKITAAVDQKVNSLLVAVA